MSESEPTMTPYQAEKIFGKDKMQRIYEAKSMFGDMKQKMEETVHEEVGYSWTQDADEISVRIPLPPGTKAKQLAVEITRSHISAGLKGQTPTLSGAPYKPVKADGSTWSVNDGCLNITLSKVNPTTSATDFWARVLA
eukprot:RCo013067